MPSLSPCDADPVVVGLSFSRGSQGTIISCNTHCAVNCSWRSSTSSVGADDAHIGSSRVSVAAIAVN